MYFLCSYAAGALCISGQNVYSTEDLTSPSFSVKTHLLATCPVVLLLTSPATWGTGVSSKGQSWKRTQQLRTCHAVAKLSWKLGERGPLLSIRCETPSSGVRGGQYSVSTRFGKPHWPITHHPQGEQRTKALGFGNNTR